MTKRISFVFGGICSVLAAGGSAFAADMPVKAPPLPPPTPVFNWTGFYAGLNLGGVWANAPHNVLDADDPGSPSLTGFTNHPTGVIGGAQIGYNWQFNKVGGWGNAWVLGIEADIQASSQRGRKNFSFADGSAPGEVETPGGPGEGGGNGNGGGGNGGGGNGNGGGGNGGGGNGGGDCNQNHGNNDCQGEDNDDSWFGTVRGRAGIAFDRVLPFVTGGWAYGEHKTFGTVNAFNAAGAVIDSTTFGTSKFMNGWTVGGGVEWAFADHWSAKFEYLYIDFGKLIISTSTSPGHHSRLQMVISPRTLPASG